MTSSHVILVFYNSASQHGPRTCGPRLKRLPTGSRTGRNEGHGEMMWRGERKGGDGEGAQLGTESSVLSFIVAFSNKIAH